MVCRQSPQLSSVKAVSAVALSLSSPLIGCQGVEGIAITYIQSLRVSTKTVSSNGKGTLKKQVLFLIMYLRDCLHVCECRCLRGQKRAYDPLELLLQAVVSCLGRRSGN